VRQTAFSKLAQDATRNGAVIGSFMDEAHSLLAVLNASKYPFCSDGEMDYFRQLVFRSRNIRGAGRMRDGKLECSALFRPGDLQQIQHKPQVTLPDGTKIYHDVAPYLSTVATVFLLQQGDSYVVEDPNFNNHVQQVNPNSEITMTDVPSQRKARANGIPTMIPGAVRDRDWQGNLGDMLYVTRCMPRNYICSSAYGSFSAALFEDRGRLFSWSALGGLSGAVLMLLLALVGQHRSSMVWQLRRSISRGEVRLVYQPIQSLATGKIVEAEALARWNDEDGIAVSPEVFVRLAEERGFVGDLTRLVVRKALRDFGSVLREDGDFRLGINITASDLADEEFLPMLERSLAAAGVAPRRLAIEVTESSTARHQLAMEAIRQLRQRGHSVRIDDFGTGYSSLAYLKDLSVDAIKIDMAFTQAIGTEAIIGSILPQILSMAQSLDLQVIVEGIETIEQSNYFVSSLRPTLGQGWLIGRPISAEEFRARLAASEKEPETPVA
jgi:sensor c-di-GMP phosphodiesterase-like protein